MVTASLVAKMESKLPAVQETWVWSLTWEDPLEKGMATRFHIFAWRISGREEPGSLQWWDRIELDTAEWLTLHTIAWMGILSDTSGREPACQCRRCKRHGFDPRVEKIPWRRHGNPLQYSSPENSMDRGTWQASAHGVTQSWSQRKWLSTHIAWLIAPYYLEAIFCVASFHSGLL